MIKAIIFDRDGVIVNSEALHVFSVVKSFEELGITVDDDTKKYIVAKHTDKYKDYLLDKYDFDYETFRIRQKEIYYNHIGNIDLFEDIINLVKDINKTNKYMLALTTSSSRHGTNIILKQTGLENIFDIIVTKEDYQKGKPDPEPYILTAQNLGVNPKDCLVFEDSDVGVQSAKNAGMRCVAIPNEYTKNHDLSIADLIVTDRDKINIDLLIT